MAATYVTPTLIGASVAIGVSGQFLLRAGMERVGAAESVTQAISPRYVLNAFSHWQVPLAILLYALGAILWMAVLSRERVSFAYPFLGLTYILSMVGGALIFNEPIRPAGIVGTLLIAGGVVLVAYSGA